jgi:hypothetical protein
MVIISAVSSVKYVQWVTLRQTVDDLSFSLKCSPTECSLALIVVYEYKVVYGVVCVHVCKSVHMPIRVDQLVEVSWFWMHRVWYII